MGGEITVREEPCYNSFKDQELCKVSVISISNNQIASLNSQVTFSVFICVGGKWSRDMVIFSLSVA